MSAVASILEAGVITAPNITDPDPLPPDSNIGITLMCIAVSLTILTISTTTARVWARWKRNLIGWDDRTIVMCTALGFARTVTQIISVFHGNGRHKWYISTEAVQYVIFLRWMASIFLYAALCLLKTSICLLILRIKTTKVIKISMYSMISGLAITNGLCIIILLLRCWPTNKYWAPNAPGKCWSSRIETDSIYLQASYSVVTDLICALLPVIVLWKVDMAFRIKLAICGLMSMGLITTVCAIARAIALGMLHTDPSWEYCRVSIWGNSELHFGILATNISLSRSIFSYFAGTDKSPATDSRPTPYNLKSLGDLSKHGWLNLSNTSQNTGMETEISAVRDCKTWSMGSMADLRVIRKTTEIHIVRESNPSVVYAEQESWDPNLPQIKGSDDEC